MPWSTPLLSDVRALVRDSIRGQMPGADATIPNSVLRVMSDVQGGLCHLVLQYIDWLALQLLPDSAEQEWLDRHGQIWLTNADGSQGRKMATFADGDVLATGAGGSIIPQFAQLIKTDALGNQIAYQTMQQVIVLADAPTPVSVQALDTGIGGNCEPGDFLSFSGPAAGVDATVIVDIIDGGADEESDDDLRGRVLRRIRQPPMGGASTDYEAWALAVPGVTRAWCAPLEMGIGTVTVRFLMDQLRASDDGWPQQSDIDTVTAYMDTVRPVAVKDFFVLAPIKQFIDVEITQLNPDTPDIRAAIEVSLDNMLLQLAAPGQTIFAVWKSYAVMNAPGIISFDLVNTADDIMLSPGNMAVLGDIVYD